MLRESDPQKACDILVEQANLAGGVDNISVIVVQM
jgi:serine/threonine protein phosphatase PrpC